MSERILVTGGAGFLVHKMKVCIVGPGIQPIPPTGWGAVEILIHDTRLELEKLGHSVLVVNTPDRQEIISQVNKFEPQFVHIQYDSFTDVVPHLTCKSVAMTSHYGYLEQSKRWAPDGYPKIADNFCKSTADIFALSPGIASVYEGLGIDSSRVHVVPNGVSGGKFRFAEACENPHLSIYLAKVEPRKRQKDFQGVEGLCFAGNCIDNRFDQASERYLGEWSKKKLYSSLTKYANLVLLSDGEAHPLVCMEALVAGLGLVVSECSQANLDTSLPFIDVIPESRISDLRYVQEIIEKNRNVSVGMRNEIRQYGLTFSWKKIVAERYVPAILAVLDKGEQN